MSQIIYILPEGLPAPKIHTRDATSLNKAKKKQFCRLCLAEGHDFIKVLSDVMQSHQLELARRIKECVSIEMKVEDQLPHTICHKCHGKISDWAEFKDICTKSNELMLSELASPLFEDNENNNDENSLDGNRKKPIKDVKIDEAEFFKALCKVEAEMGFKKKDEGDEDGAHQCEVCFAKFSTYLDYVDHQDSHDGEITYNCDLCPESFPRRRDLAYHERNHRMPCHKCGKVINRRSMTPHMILHSDKFVCPHCQSHFISNCQMEEHISSVHLNIKRHVCETCGKSYNTKTVFDCHLKSHNVQRAYKCKKCPYSAKTSLILYNHMSVHGQDHCRCRICGKVFKSKRNLTDHMRRSHPDANRKDIQKRVTCPVCDLGFVQKWQLRAHMDKRHDGVKIEVEEETLVEEDSAGCKMDDLVEADQKSALE